MASSVEAHDKHVFTEYEELFFDTNIWYFIEGPNAPDDRRTRIYSKVLSDALRSQSTICVDVVALTEFANRFLRTLYRRGNWENKGIEFKNYRGIGEYEEDVAETAAAVKRIIDRCRIIDTPLSSLDIDSIISDFEKNKRDLNDVIIAELCKSNNLILVTDDADFKDYDLRLITGNPRLLRSGEK
jgi:predicted nucleic acid-binding protein